MAKLRHAKTVYTLSERFYRIGAPVWITGGELLRAGELLYCRVTLEVLCREKLRGVTVAIQALDGKGNRLGLPLPYRYRVNAGRDARIGQRESILLPLEDAASFTAWVTRVDFAEGAPWLCEERWDAVPAQPTLEQYYGDADLAEQFRIRYGRDCRCAVAPLGALWRCTCETVNLPDESACRRCHRMRGALEAIDAEALRKETAARKLKEPLRERAARSENRAMLKKLLLTAGIVLPILILVIGLLIAVPKELERQSVYDGAQRLAALGEFNAARAIFVSLEDYRDSREMAGDGLDYLSALALLQSAEADDASALQRIGHTRADLNEDTTAAILLYEAAQAQFEALGGYRDSEALARRCAESLAACREALRQAAFDRASALLEAGKLSEARAAYLALGAEEEAKEPVYRKAAALTSFIHTYNIRGIYASLSMSPGSRSSFSMSKEKALTLGSQSVQDLLASCGEDGTALELEDTPGGGLVPLDEAVKALIADIEGYKDTDGLLAVIEEATDYTREFFTLCENGDLPGAYEWLLGYEGTLPNREQWLADLTLYMPFCRNWEFYLGDNGLIPYSAGQSGECGKLHSRVLLRGDTAILRLSDAERDCSVELTAPRGEVRFFNREQEGVFYLAVVTNSGYLSYLYYRDSGSIITSCEYEPE